MLQRIGDIKQYEGVTKTDSRYTDEVRVALGRHGIREVQSLLRYSRRTTRITELGIVRRAGTSTDSQELSA